MSRARLNALATESNPFLHSPAMTPQPRSASARRAAQQKLRLELLARCVHKARLQGRKSLTFPLTAAPGQGEFDVPLVELYSQLADPPTL